MTADVHFNCLTTRLFFQKETKTKILEGNQNRNFRWKLKQKFWKENKNFRRKPSFGRKIKISEGKQKFWKETKNFRRKPKISEGNQKFWKENKIKFWKETKKIGIEIFTPLSHRTFPFF